MDPKEIDIALEMRKSIIAVKPWDKNASQKQFRMWPRNCGWNSSSIVSAIRNNCI